MIRVKRMSQIEKEQQFLAIVNPMIDRLTYTDLRYASGVLEETNIDLLAGAIADNLYASLQIWRLDELICLKLKSEDMNTDSDAWLNHYKDDWDDHISVIQKELDKITGNR